MLGLAATATATTFTVGVLYMVSKSLVSRWTKGSCKTPQSEKELQTLLEKDGINTALFGQGKAKTLTSLLHDLPHGDCKLKKGKAGKLQRIVEQSFDKICYSGKVLVEKSQVLADGRERKRNFLLAEKRNPSDACPLEGALRGIGEELQLEMTRQTPGLVHCQQDDQTCVEETDSASYPGLPALYLTHKVCLDIAAGSEAANAFNQKCGGETCNAFSKSEMTSTGVMQHNWIWLDLADAQAAKVKGLV